MIKNQQDKLGGPILLLPSSLLKKLEQYAEPWLFISKNKTIAYTSNRVTSYPAMQHSSSIPKFGQGPWRPNFRQDHSPTVILALPRLPRVIPDFSSFDSVLLSTHIPLLRIGYGHP
ncbi:MAG: hypothetical protein LBV45_11025 [Xanthomonadaceae bacterium]|jgi:hypothetical protein|nr:hypothetical protein [Xanthomonadaceae bacterium]